MISDTLQLFKELMIRRLKLKVTSEQINENTQFFGPDGLGLDSIDVLELVVGIKKEFGVAIADRKTAEKVFTSVGAVVEFIEDKR
ncbi:MAG: acyl carrier protein [Dissulfurispiraceae bacterium]